MSEVKTNTGGVVSVRNMKILKVRHICLRVDNCENHDTMDTEADAMLTIEQAKELIRLLQERIDNENLDM